MVAGSSCRPAIVEAMLLFMHMLHSHVTHVICTKCNTPSSLR
jgi:hypothetical protein